MFLNSSHLDLERVQKLNKKVLNKNGRYILYWMQSSRRLQYNYALDFAVELSLKNNIPLYIFGGLDVNESYQNPRLFQFYSTIWLDIHDQLQHENCHCFINLDPPFYDSKLHSLVKSASAVITDEYPDAFVFNRTNKFLNDTDCCFYNVDSNGIIPLSCSSKAPYSAFIFRRIVQKYFANQIMRGPHKSPFSKLRGLGYSKYDKQLSKGGNNEVEDTHIYPIHGITSRDEALLVLQDFINKKLLSYDSNRNNLDISGTSNLSSSLASGIISSFEVVLAVLERFTDWSVNSLGLPNGKNTGFFNLPASVEAFFDQLICWREVGFHFNYHTPQYMSLLSLPEWVQKIMFFHANDQKEYIYSYNDFEQAKTHDPIWNAAQNQLITEGFIHNYLRMLWGKKIIEWSPDYKTALDYMLALNNKYALDGRDPVSYTGIFWCFGRFDRAWSERPVFGKIRYMSSDSTQRKLKIKNYLEKYSSI